MVHQTTAEATPPKGFMGRLSIWLVNKFLDGSAKKARELERFLKFMFVGTMGFVVDAGTSYVLLSLIQPSGKDLLMINVIALIAFFTAITHNFIWNRYWTYPDSRSKKVRNQLIQFATVNSMGGGIRIVIISLLQPFFFGIVTDLFSGTDENLLVKLGYYPALMVAVFVVLFWNFLVNRLWTFSDVD